MAPRKMALNCGDYRARARTMDWVAASRTLRVRGTGIRFGERATTLPGRYGQYGHF